MQFFQAGFETTSSTISFALYELCIHPEIQERLRDEITENIKRHNGLTWDGISEMTYLEMVLAGNLEFSTFFLMFSLTSIVSHNSTSGMYVQDKNLMN